MRFLIQLSNLRMEHDYTNTTNNNRETILNRISLWVEEKAHHAHANKVLGLVSFVEASFFPIPPFVLIVAILAHDRKPSWIKLAFIGASASVLGGIFGYFLGGMFYDYLGKPLISFYGVTSQVDSLGVMFKDHVFATIFLASISPLPYKVFALSAGLFSVNLWQFIVASIIGRGVRFLFVSYISHLYGIRAKNFILSQQKTTLYVTGVFLIALVVYFLLQSRGIL